MSWITQPDRRSIPNENRVDDDDNILRVHAIHSRVMKLHFDLYVELMCRPGPLTAEQREMIGVAVSHANQCRY